MILTRMLKIPAISGRAIGGGPGAIRSRADPGPMPGPGDRASARRVQSSRGTYLVAIPAGLVRALGLEAGQSLAFDIDGDQIRAGRADVRQVSCAGAC